MTDKQQARIIGVLYLIIIVCGLFSEGFVRGTIIVPGQPMDTIANLKGSESLFRIAFVADLIMVMADIAVAVLFYFLLSPVSKVAALLAAFFRLGQAAVIGMNLLNHFSPLLALNDPGLLETMSFEQVGSLAAFHLSLHKYGYLISQIFFSFNCLLMGYLLYSSKLFPKVLGVGVGLAAVAYFTEGLSHFVSPSLANAMMVVLVIPIVAELSLCLWLLIKGVQKVPSSS